MATKSKKKAIKSVKKPAAGVIKKAAKKTVKKAKPDAEKKASISAKAPDANGVRATLKVTFTEVDPKLSTLTATYNGVPQTINQSASIVFDNVKSGKRIKIQGNSLGLTAIAIDVAADPPQMNFPKGKINGSFFII